MNAQELLKSIAEHVSARASVKNVYGEPVVVGDRTVIPVAHVRYGFGGGSGHPKGDEAAGGGGGGGGVSATPSGALEITPEGTRFIKFHDRRDTRIALALGFVLGAVMVAFTVDRQGEARQRK
jgi:uncharacterized spore protein YtfJ